MIKLENVTIHGLEETIRGMRNPMNSWDKSDSGICGGGDQHIGCDNCCEHDCGHSFDGGFHVGKADHELMMKLAAGGPVHAKYRRMITVYVDITAPLYWWKEFDTYKVGTVANSCSTMHKIHSKEFTLDDFSCEHLFDIYGAVDREEDIESVEELSAVSVNGNKCYFSPLYFINMTCNIMNRYRKKYLETKDKKYWWQMIQLLPSSYNQKRTVMLNYEVLVGIYRWRKEHKLDEWREFCQWIEKLPYSEIITLA